MNKFKIVGLFTGRPKEIGPNNLLTSIDKTAVVGPLIIKSDSLVGDKVVNLKYHGGPDRVIHHYSLEQYDYLKTIFPEHEELFKAGSYGENLTTDKLTEADLCIGDIFKLGSAKIQLSEGRKPCGTIDVKYGIKGVLKEIISTGRYGWFYKVLEEGEVNLEDELEFIERPYPNLNLKTLIEQLFGKNEKNLALITEAYNCPALSQRWKDITAKYINN